MQKEWPPCALESRMTLERSGHGLNELMQSVYDDLRRIAANHLRNERPDHTLQPTALLHEMYVKLAEDQERRFSSPTHFLALASRVMRQVLVDYARTRGRKKRGAGKRNAADDISTLKDLQIESDHSIDPVEILELNRAIDALAQEDELLARLIEMRYFGGMTAKEAAEEIGQSVHIVRHDLRLAQAWLKRHLDRHPKK
jgi:RNA polymerase sigma factor (TIGR02999 family)